ncbi:phosphopantetheine-binding protein [Streptomyces sp. NPDC006476]|uniref:acyl carrier protein n=1 Tax=Streptomyces sp. NPDC006476 TaxID=3157175 RepID=UPI0033A749E9
MNRTEVVHQIESALSEALERPIDGLSEDVRLFDDMHLDSTSVLEVLMTLEDTVGVEVDPEQLEMADFATVGSFADYLLRQTPAATDQAVG